MIHTTNFEMHKYSKSYQKYVKVAIDRILKRSPSIWQNPIRGHEPMANQWKRRWSNLNSGFIGLWGGGGNRVIKPDFNQTVFW